MSLFHQRHVLVGANEAVAAHLRAEQDLGRVREDADSEAAAAMLVGACFQRAFLGQFLAEEADPDA